MDCKSASILMMKYMDKVLTEHEAQNLNVHIVKCSACKEDFMLYEDMMEEFDKQSVCLFEPPCDFEERVMEIVCRITPDYGRTYSQDTVIGFVFGTFSVIFGTGVVLSLYRTEIMEAALKYPYIGALMEKAAYASDAAAGFVGNSSQLVLYYLNALSSLIEAAKYGILAVVVALVAAQWFIYSKNKVEA